MRAQELAKTCLVTPWTQLEHGDVFGITASLLVLVDGIPVHFERSEYVTRLETYIDTPGALSMVQEALVRSALFAIQVMLEQRERAGQTVEPFQVEVS
jgi:hypothetical protein